MNFVAVTVFAFFLLLITFLLLERTQKDILLSVDNMIILGAGFIWGILFPLTYFYSMGNPNNQDLKIVSEYDAWEMFRYYVCIAVFLFLFVKTFRLFLNKNRDRSIFRDADKTDDPLAGENANRLFIATLLLFAVGVVSDWLYCRAYGGYFGYLEYSAFIRSGVTSLVNNPWSFLIVFRDCVIISSYLFFAQFRKNGSIQIGRMILFVISFVYSLLILYANRGRLTFIIFVAVFVFSYWLNKKNLKLIKLKSVFFIIMAFLIFVLSLNWTSAFLGRTSELKAMDLLCNEIAFAFSNFKILLTEMNLDNARLFLDIVNYPLFLLPSSWWRKIMPNTASDFVTILVFGHKKGEGGVLGETPIDSISIGYLQFGIVGVCVFAVFFALLAAKLYKQITEIPVNKAAGVLAVNVILDIFIRSLLYADSYNIVQRFFSLLVFALIYWGVGLFLKKRRATTVT